MSSNSLTNDKLESIIASTQSSLIRYCIGFVGSLELAQEIVQDSYLKLWDAPPDNIETYFREWLFTVVRNRSLDHLRKETTVKGKKVMLQAHNEENYKEIESELEHKQKHTKVEQLFNELDPEAREILRLKFQEEMTYHQIARITGKSVSHVGVIIHNSVKRLREELGKEGGLQ
jgi:RNA polymerase sigma factor, sigma-70 family